MKKVDTFHSLRNQLVSRIHWLISSSKRSLSIVSPATKQFIREAWETQEHSLLGVLHSYAYANWPYLYIAIGKGDHPIAKKFALVTRIWQYLFPQKKGKAKPAPSLTQATGTVADGYHGKAMPLTAARQLVTVKQPIKVPDLEQVIPYIRARGLILQNPDHIVVMVCPCRAAKENPCQPLDVCLVIGEPFASFMLEHHPSRARRITQAEAVEIIEQQDAQGRVHHAFFQDTMLGRLFGLCNCCSCCCGAIKAHRNGTPMLASSGYLAQVDEDECIACNDCQAYCQFEALDFVSGTMCVDEERCMGCGVCVSKCPQEAITLRREPSKGIPLEIDSLSELMTVSRTVRQSVS